MSDVAYQVVHDPAWEAAIASWRWEPVGLNAWQKSGACPHCGDDITIPYNSTLVLGVEEYEENPLIDVSCACSVAHPDHAAGDGCGRFGRIAKP